MTTAQPPPAFLATARGGHSADPAARCPYCGAPAGLHRGVDLASSPHFPMRAVICAQLDEVCPCGGVGWVSVPACGGGSQRVRCALCNVEAPHCRTCDDRMWVEHRIGGEVARVNCPVCAGPCPPEMLIRPDLLQALPATRPPELTRCATCDGRRWVGDGYREPCGNCNAEALP